MALNIKNREVGRLAEEVSRLTSESKTEAIRRALEERKARLAIAYERPQTKERLIEFFERTIWPEVPSEVLGKTLTKRERDARGAIARSLRQFRAQVILFTEEHFDVAADAFLRYGKGRHPAALNFGDCMSYAVAALSGLPLLFTGNDFAKTDIPRA